MNRMMFVIVGIALPLTVPAQTAVDMQIQSLAAPIDKTDIEAIDLNGNNNGQIDPGAEAQAVVRYVNDKIFREFDKNHDGKLAGQEAQDYVDKKVQPALDELNAYFAKSAYPDANKRFAGGVPIADEKNVVATSPLAPRFPKFAWSIGYGQKGEAGKDTETIKSGFEYKLGSFSLRQTPVVVGVKLSYSKENTFLLTETNKVERWTLEPARLSFGVDKWPVEPSIGLGYGRSNEEVVATSGTLSRKDKDEYVWDFGIAIPIKGKWAKFTVNHVVRMDSITSGKQSDDVSLGLEINFQKLLGLPK